ncbi:MAG: DNA-directed RNA polymerase subunit omega [Rhizobiales bacterium]|nr:DNA-directed RNA polymerase subunit omega [Hyphomicrobiales bacterium]NRB15066.1 DNA-directed RNA polymerase subunit omega [Hyphomicrobiales bacterium]
MARVTVEDCIEKINNRFELVLLSGHRARMLAGGAEPTVERDNDKNPVIALREIGDNMISAADLEEEFIHSMQRYVEVDEPETEIVPMISATGEVSNLGENPDKTTFDQMGEDDLLKAIEALPKPK